MRLPSLRISSISSTMATYDSPQLDPRGAPAPEFLTMPSSVDVATPSPTETAKKDSSEIAGMHCIFFWFIVIIGGGSVLLGSWFVCCWYGNRKEARRNRKVQAKKDRLQNEQREKLQFFIDTHRTPGPMRREIQRCLNRHPTVWEFDGADRLLQRLQQEGIDTEMLTQEAVQRTQLRNIARRRSTAGHVRQSIERVLSGDSWNEPYAENLIESARRETDAIYPEEQKGFQMEKLRSALGRTDLSKSTRKEIETLLEDGKRNNYAWDFLRVDQLLRRITGQTEEEIVTGVRNAAPNYVDRRTPPAYGSRPNNVEGPSST